MKMMFIVDRLDSGGAGRVISVLANEFYKQGNKVCIVVYFSSEIIYPLDAGIGVISMVSKETKRNDDNLVGRVSKLRNAYKKYEVDIVISFMTELNIYAIVANMFSGKRKLIISERNNPYKSPIQKRVRLLRKLLYRYADGYVFQTEDARDYFSCRIAKHSVIIQNPISDTLPDVYIGEREKKIVSVGRLTEQKNYSLAIEATKKVLEEHPEYIYEIYGDGELYEMYAKKIRKMGLEGKIILKGHQSNIYERIKKARVFLLSSDYEGMSNALIEAMALGIPVISTDHPIGGAKELIKNGINGLLVPVGNSMEMTKGIERLITDEKLAFGISDEAIKMREKLSKGRVVAQWKDYIDRVLGGR